MKKLGPFISALLLLTISVSYAWALPNCLGSYSEITWDNCIGTYIWKNKNKYVGGFKDGKKNGYGIYTFANGNKYSGEHQDGNRHGQGTFSWADGNKYVGEYKDNKRNGQGTFTYANGEKYLGKYKDGKKNSQGIYIYNNGDKYVGSFMGGKMHGEGTYTWADRSKWDGAWENDTLNGYAITYYTNGNIYQEGIFEENKFLRTEKRKKIGEAKILLLKTTFIKLSKQHRKKLQKKLKDLGFYQASIDGLFGPITLAALAGYNKQNLNDAALTKTQNVGNLITDLLKGK
jgi:hypothetical protein